MVTPADLNKTLARAYFYHLIAELELALAAWLRRHFRHDPSRILSFLRDKRRKDIETQIGRLEQGNADVDPIQLLDLSDLMTIVEKEPELRGCLGFASQKSAEDALGGLVDLRNRTMHLVRPLLKEIPQDLYTLRNRVERAERVLETLQPPTARARQPGEGQEPL